MGGIKMDGVTWVTCPLCGWYFKPGQGQEPECRCGNIVDVPKERVLKMGRICIGLKDEGFELVIDNRDINTTWIHMGDTVFEVTRNQLEENELSRHYLSITSGEQQIDLYEDDVKYLLDNMNENNPPSPEDRIIKWCIEYVYTMCLDDGEDGTMKWVLDGTELTQEELIEGFKQVAKNHDFKLDQKIDGVWVKSE
jgi:rubredoxin